jgi:hypothetical protein
MGLLQWLVSWVPFRENEYDTAEPGPRREPVSLFDQLSDEQKEAALSYDGPEVSGYGPEVAESPSKSETTSLRS